MALPLIDPSTINTHIITTDVIYLVTMLVVTNFIRMFVRPLAIEAKVIGKFVALLVVLLVSKLKKVTDEDSHHHIDSIQEQMALLRDKMKKDKMVVG